MSKSDEREAAGRGGAPPSEGADGGRENIPERLDVLGLLCPIPVQRAAGRVANLPTGALLEVLGDDPLMRLDLAAWCAREGHAVLAMEEVGGGKIRCVLRVGEARKAASMLDDGED
jgi:tRNA 2-thiouridine synthesizing protein A